MRQAEALSILKLGANVFLTGYPGSGKTYLVNAYVEYLKQHDIKAAITASTGIAATHLGGMTIHSWSGTGVNKNMTERELKKLRDNKRLVSRTQKTKVLIIDEVSMLDAQTLDCVDQALKSLRGSEQPFGGIQTVLVGDFFQLPPVRGKDEPEVEFAFEALAWQGANPVVCYLSEQYRQEDRVFLWLLESIRSGKLSDEVYECLTSRRVQVEVGEELTQLYSHNRYVDRQNEERLAELTGDEHSFDMTTKGPKGLVAQLVKGCLSPERLVLKKGAKVMFTKNNFEAGFVNGTLGEVAGFGDEGAPVVQTKDRQVIEVEREEWKIDDGGKTLATIEQIPLRLAWAITVHKSQGMTLESAVIDLSQAFEYGQGYVALSRVKTLAGLYLLGYNGRALEVHPGILEVDALFREKSLRTMAAVDRLPLEELRKKQKIYCCVWGKTRKNYCQYY